MAQYEPVLEIRRLDATSILTARSPSSTYLTPSLEPRAFPLDASFRSTYSLERAYKIYLHRRDQQGFAEVIRAASCCQQQITNTHALSVQTTTPSPTQERA